MRGAGLRRAQYTAVHQRRMKGNRGMRGSGCCCITDPSPRCLHVPGVRCQLPSPRRLRQAMPPVVLRHPAYRVGEDGSGSLVAPDRLTAARGSGHAGSVPGSGSCPGISGPSSSAARGDSGSASPRSGSPAQGLRAPYETRTRSTSAGSRAFPSIAQDHTCWITSPMALSASARRERRSAVAASATAAPMRLSSFCCIGARISHGPIPRGNSRVALKARRASWTIGP